MKSLSIPYLKELTTLSCAEAFPILDEHGAKIPVETLNWPDKFNYRPLTTVCIAHSNKAIFLLYQVHGNCLRAVNTKDNQPVFEDSCVEFFVKKPDSDYYYNFEFNCIGICKAAKHFKSRESVVDFSASQLKQIDRWSSLGNRAFNEMSGIFAWDLCVSIPFSLIDVILNQLPLKLMGNFYKCADATEQPHYVSWNPIKTDKPDFHRPEFFGELVLM
ncbi:MAG: carbohydrate-binding family 9-like protein [Bacteroidota bacterium]|nr:carbohydrate-binding family 9-like protein [Bacteroidota bacterium]